jgi:hypothetical protein
MIGDSFWKCPAGMIPASADRSKTYEGSDFYALYRRRGGLLLLVLVFGVESLSTSDSNSLIRVKAWDKRVVNSTIFASATCSFSSVVITKKQI